MDCEQHNNSILSTLYYGKNIGISYIFPYHEFQTSHINFSFRKNDNKLSNININVNNSKEIYVINCSLQNLEKNLIHEIIKYFARNFYFLQTKITLVFLNIHCIRKQDQLFFRRIMEDYSSQIRFIASCINLSSVIGPIQSRFLLKRVKKDLISSFDSIKLSKRTDIYNEYCNLRSTTDIIKDQLHLYIQRTNDIHKIDKLVQLAADAQYRDIMGNKSIFHIEYFVYNAEQVIVS